MYLRKFTSLAASLGIALSAVPVRAQAPSAQDAEDAGKQGEEAEAEPKASDPAEAETRAQSGEEDAAEDEEDDEEEADAGREETEIAAKTTKTPAAKNEAEPSEKPASARSSRSNSESGCKSTSLGDADGFWLGLCGFVALNVMHDSTQSFELGVHNNMIARLGTYAGDHDQLQFSARDSRVTIEVGAPEQHGIQASGMIEFDFNGFMSADVTEHDFYVLGTMRMRHAFLRVENPVVDVLAGQYHDLFGWGGAGFYPTTLAFLGIPGQLYHRQPQLRLSKKVSGAAAQFEVAAAVTRPVHKASGVPDIQGGIRLALNGWTGASAQGYGQPALTPLAIGVSGVGRRFEVPEFLELPGDPKTTTGWGFAANAVIPVIPVETNDDRSNALTLTAEFSTGTGVSDLYTELTGGALFPTLPNDAGRLINPPTFPAAIDSGIVTYDGNDELHTIDWRGFVAGLSYYLPIARGRVWVSGVYSQLKSNDITSLTPGPNRGMVFEKAEYFDASLFVALTEAVQTGFSFQTVEQTFGDGVTARNNRLEFGSHLFF